MMIHLPFADSAINVYAVVLAGLCVGILGGFFGLSGSFILTPMLNVLGLPMTFAVGTNLTYLFGRSVLTTVKNNAFGHVNWKLGFITGLTGAGGIYLGKALTLSLEETGTAGTVIRLLYIVLLSGAGIFMLWDYIRNRKAGNTVNVYARISAFAERTRRVALSPMIGLPNCGGKRISLWFLVTLGLLTGLLSGVLGISGSFVRLPALVFLTGLPILPALCTDTLATMISTGLGSAGFASSGHTEIVTAMLLLLGSGVGSQIGHMATKHVDRMRMRLTLTVNVMMVFTGVVLAQWGYTTPAVVLMLGSVFVLSTMVVLAMAGAVVRESRPVAGYPVASKIAPNEK